MHCRHIGKNGSYDPKTGIIEIDIASGQNGEGVMLFTAAHELTHFMAAWSPAKYKIFTDFLMKNYAEKGYSVDELVQAQIGKAKRNGRSISYDEAMEEVVADSCERMLADGNAVQKIAELRAQDKSVWSRIKNFLVDLGKKIKALYDGLDAGSAEGRYVSQMVDVMDRLQELWTEGVVEAGRNYRNAEVSSGEVSPTTEYVPQREVRAVFPTSDSAFGSMKELIQAGLEEDAIVEGNRDRKLGSIVDEIERSLPRSEADIAETEVQQAETDLEAGVKYSDRYSYDNLTNKRDMNVTEIDSDFIAGRSDVVKIAKQNAISAGGVRDGDAVKIKVADNGKYVVLSTNGLKHGLDRRLNELAGVTAKAGEIIQNSIQINELTPSKENASGSYVLIGAAKNANGDFYVVRSVVNQFNSE